MLVISIKTPLFVKITFSNKISSKDWKSPYFYQGTLNIMCKLMNLSDISLKIWMIHWKKARPKHWKYNRNGIIITHCWVLWRHHLVCLHIWYLMAWKIIYIDVYYMANCATCVFQAFILLMENARGTFGHVGEVNLFYKEIVKGSGW